MRKLFLVVVALLFGSFLYAQNEIYIGPKAGLNLATQTVDNPLASYSLRPGFTGGAFVEFDFGNYSIQPEVLFSVQGSSIEAHGDDLYASFRYTAIPIMLKYELMSGISILAGPQIGFLMCATSDYHPILNKKFKEQHYTTAYKSTDFLIAFGFGWQSDRNLNIDARYSLGLSSIDDFAGVPDTKNSVMSITVGYRLLTLNEDAVK